MDCLGRGAGAAHAQGPAVCVGVEHHAVAGGDAAFTYRRIIETILTEGGDYFLFVKANQPELEAELAHAFGDDSPLTAGQLSRPAA